MTWTHSYGADALESPSDRLAAARDAFREAQRTLEEAREDLLQTHTQTARLWASGR